MYVHGYPTTDEGIGFETRSEIKEVEHTESYVALEYQNKSQVPDDIIEIAHEVRELHHSCLVTFEGGYELTVKA